MTQEDLGERCGLYRTYLSRIESGGANPTLTMIHALAESLGVEVPVLFGAPALPRKTRRTASRSSRGRVR